MPTDKIVILPIISLNDESGTIVLNSSYCTIAHQTEALYGAAIGVLPVARNYYLFDDTLLD
jgi:hypothetical protein